MRVKDALRSAISAAFVTQELLVENTEAYQEMIIMNYETFCEILVILSLAILVWAFEFLAKLLNQKMSLSIICLFKGKKLSSTIMLHLNMSKLLFVDDSWWKLIIVHVQKHVIVETFINYLDHLNAALELSVFSGMW